jgi:hypothetical protein
MSGPPPEQMTLYARQQLAHDLWRRHGAIIDALESAQAFASLREHLGAAADELARLARLYWPEQAWEAQSNGPPRHGDWHVKVSSLAGADEEVHLVVLTQRIDAEMRLADVSSFKIALRAAPMLTDALERHLDYWQANPPNGGR